MAEVERVVSTVNMTRVFAGHHFLNSTMMREKISITFLVRSLSGGDDEESGKGGGEGWGRGWVESIEEEEERKGVGEKQGPEGRSWE